MMKTWDTLLLGSILYFPWTVKTLQGFQNSWEKLGGELENKLYFWAFYTQFCRKCKPVCIIFKDIRNFVNDYIITVLIIFFMIIEDTSLISVNCSELGQDVALFTAIVLCKKVNPLWTREGVNDIISMKLKLFVFSREIYKNC